MNLDDDNTNIDKKADLYVQFDLFDYLRIQYIQSIQNIQIMRQTNFINPAFEAIFKNVSDYMPAITFIGIIGTYLITAGINVYFIPLPLILSIPAALALQFGRFAIVFIDFLHPTGKRSIYPSLIATGATIAALVELYHSVSGIMQQSEVIAVYLFLSMIIISGYVLELNFIRKGYEAYQAPKKDNFRSNGQAASNGQMLPELQQRH